MSHIDSPEWVGAQYSNASNLDARVRLYRFARDPERWMDWLWKRLELEAKDRILEVGAGSGTLWRENASRLPEGIDLTVSDLSPGMLQEAQRRLGSVRARLRFRQLDVREISEPDDSFDVVIARYPDGLRGAQRAL